MTKHPTWLLLCSCLLLSSCGVNDGATVVHAQSDAPSRSWYASGAAPDTMPLERALHGGITVAPDRGLAMLEVAIEANDRAAAMRRIRRVASELAAVSGAECRVEPWSFAPIEHAGDVYRAGAQLRLDVSLIGAGTIEARQARIEACLGSLDALDPARFDGVSVQRGALVLTVDDPSQHRGALLERHMSGLHAVAAYATVPPQFRSNALRCTSSGEVRIEARSLRGIDLAVDFTCTPEAGAAAQFAAAQ
jgi:hypothetical protein